MNKYFVSQRIPYEGETGDVLNTKAEVIEWITKRLGGEATLDDFSVIYGELLEIQPIDIVKSVKIKDEYKYR